MNTHAHMLKLVNKNTKAPSRTLTYTHEDANICRTHTFEHTGKCKICRTHIRTRVNTQWTHEQGS